jgi:hypothetical protein
MNPATPRTSGWYWYREHGLNLNRLMPAWVFDSSGILYAELCPVHELATFCRTRRVTDCQGDWLGPMEVPTA